ncbi:MAG: GNAT family N-acetyltransferase [Bacillus sp. (in: firmicutes)]
MAIGTNHVLPVIETERLLLRKITFKDAEDIYQYTSDPAVSQHVTWDPHHSLTDTKGYIHSILQQYEMHRLAPWGIQSKESNKLIGTIEFVSWQPLHKTAEIGYVLSQAYWNQGIITEAAQSVIAFGFKEMNTVRIQARCLTENIGSQKVMEKTGMTFEGTIRKGLFVKGKHRDIHIYSILREEFTEPT